MAIVAITKKGAALGRRLRQQVSGSFLFVPDKLAGSTVDEVTFTRVKDLVASIFHGYRFLVLIMATGIAVRLVSGEIKDKHLDPGIIVIDDAGSFCISLLSGHIGGANDMAVKIASLIGAQPVITTASDVNRMISVDILGREFGWEIENDKLLKSASTALVNGEDVGIYQEAGETNWWPKAVPLPDNVTVYDSLEDLQKSSSGVALIITDRCLSEETCRKLPDNTIVYRPKSLAVGVGCNRGTGAAAIDTAISEALSNNRLSIKSVKVIATIDLKKDEPGLLEYAQAHSLKLEYYNRETLRDIKVPSPSALALQHTGTPSVCEAAALLSSRSPALLVPKVSLERAVTVAVARLPFNDRPHLRKGCLFLVGIGPGDPKHLTFAAREALEQSEVIIGYKTYTELIKPLLGNKQVIATGMGDELSRVKSAISLVKQGKTAAIISGGDTGIYGMAGTVGEFLHWQPAPDMDIKVIPGIPAIAACAALLGSPVSGDFVAISLSDYLVPWEEICRRLELAAQGDFVIVLYNPKSKHRRSQLIKAREIFLHYQLPSTPVGIITSAFRHGQSITLTNLEHMLESEINMNTTIFIGNSRTSITDGWMTTPRGYQTKYDWGEETDEMPGPKN